MMYKGKFTKQLIIGMTSVFLLTGCGTQKGISDMDQIKKGNQVMGVSVHDPSIIKDNDKYYIFGTHMEAAASDDLTSFKSFASGVNASNPLFDNLFDDPENGAFSFVGEYENGGYAVWAPEVIYNKKMNKYVMYFSVSHDYRTSGIAYATADSIEGPYHYENLLISSGFTNTTVDKTNVKDILGEDSNIQKYLSSAQYNNLNYPNCIDPTVFYDENDDMWMIYGSWSGGIFLLQIDEETGKVIYPNDENANEIYFEGLSDKEKNDFLTGKMKANGENYLDPYFGRYLMGGLHNSCEGPYMLYDEDTNYYYLFVSYGGLTRTGGYQIRLFRSEKLTGPYVDANGEHFGYVSDHSGYGLKMMGNYRLPSLKTAYMAPGHNSAFKDDDGKYYVVYHQRFDSGTEYHEPRVHQMYVNEDGWFVAAPFATNGESLSDQSYSSIKDLAGNYFFVNHGTDISENIHAPIEVELKNSGKLIINGKTALVTLTNPEKHFVNIQIGDVVYKGVVGEMIDEAGNNVRFISAAGNNNETIWLVMYI